MQGGVSVGMAGLLLGLEEARRVDSATALLLVYPVSCEPVRPMAIAQGMEGRRGTGLHPLYPQDVRPGAAMGFRKVL